MSDFMIVQWTKEMVNGVFNKHTYDAPEHAIQNIVTGLYELLLGDKWQMKDIDTFNQYPKAAEDLNLYIYEKFGEFAEKTGGDKVSVKLVWMNYGFSNDKEMSWETRIDRSKLKFINNEVMV